MPFSYLTMGKSYEKAAVRKKGRDISPQKKALQSTNNNRLRRRKKKNKQQETKLVNDSPNSNRSIQKRTIIDFSKFAAGSTGSVVSQGGGSLSSIPENNEELERAVTPTSDNRQQAANASVAKMTDAQRKEFVPIKQTFGQLSDEEASPPPEDTEDNASDEDKEEFSNSHSDEQEVEEDDDPVESDAEDSKPAAKPRRADTSAKQPNNTPPRPQVAHNPYATAPTPMDIERTGQEWDLNAGPTDATIPRTVFRSTLRRVEIKVTTQGSTQSDVELVNAIRAVMVKLKEADTSMTLLPYSAAQANSLAPLHRFPSDIPSTIGQLKKYFQNATPRMNGGSYYVRALLCFNKPFDETLDDIKWWLGENKAGIWVRRVQEEKVTRLGWFLYSVRSMDIERLTRFYSYRYGTKVGLRYMAINTGRRGKYNPDVQLPKAIHIEVAEGQAARVSTMLNDDYSSAQTTFPMGTKMRFVPDLNQLMNFQTRAKSIQLSNRQMAFEEKLGYAMSWEIADLHSPIPSLGNQCLAEFITSIPSKSAPHLMIFHSVATGYQAGTTAFSFIPQLEEEARTMVAALLPYLRSQHGDVMFKYFTSVAGDRALSCTWDPETNQVISPGDIAVDAATVLDAEFHFEDDTTAVLINLPTTPAAPTGGTAAFAKETDSVSTLQQNTNKKSTRKVPQEPLPPKKPPPKQAPQRTSIPPAKHDSDDRSHQSTASALTMETLDTAVQSAVTQFFEHNMETMINRAIAHSMQHMHGLAVSANTQRETDEQQTKTHLSGTSHQHTADDTTQSGSPSGASANG